MARITSNQGLPIFNMPRSNADFSINPFAASQKGGLLALQQARELQERSLVPELIKQAQAGDPQAMARLNSANPQAAQGLIKAAKQARQQKQFDFEDEQQKQSFGAALAVNTAQKMQSVDDISSKRAIMDVALNTARRAGLDISEIPTGSVEAFENYVNNFTSKVASKSDKMRDYMMKRGIDLKYEVDKARMTAPYKAKGTQLRVDPKTGEITFTQGGRGVVDDKAALQRPVATEMQKDVIGGMETLESLAAIEKDFNPKNLTTMGRLYNTINEASDKLGVSIDPKTLRNNVRFRNNVDQFFNAYRKEITGAAAAEKELEQLKKSLLNTDQGPEAFKASLGQIKEKTQRALRLKRRLLREGLDVGSKDFGSRLDELYLQGMDDDPRDRVRELRDFFKKRAKNKEEFKNLIQRQLIQEGYIGQEV